MSPFEPVLDAKPAPTIVEPDLGTKIRYRLGCSIPEEYRGWVERDVAAKAFFLWQLWPFVLGKIVAVSLLDLFIDDFNPWPYLIGGLIGIVGVLIFFTDFKRRQMLAWHEKRWKRQRERDEGPDLRRFP